MSTLDGFLLIAEAWALLYLLWKVLEITFDAIEQYHAAWREAQAGAEAPAKPKIGARSSDSR